MGRAGRLGYCEADQVTGRRDVTKKQPDVIKFQAQVYQIRTTVDGGANVTLALSGKEIKALTQLLQVKEQVGVILEVVAVPVRITIQPPVKNDNTRRKERYPYRTK